MRKDLKILYFQTNLFNILGIKPLRPAGYKTFTARPGAILPCTQHMLCKAS